MRDIARFVGSDARALRPLTRREIVRARSATRGTGTRAWLSPLPARSRGVPCQIGGGGNRIPPGRVLVPARQVLYHSYSPPCVMILSITLWYHRLFYEQSAGFFGSDAKLRASYLVTVTVVRSRQRSVQVVDRLQYGRRGAHLLGPRYSSLRKQ